MAYWITILAVVLVFFFTVYLLYKYPTKGTHPSVFVAVFISYFITFSILAILPYDVDLATGGEGHDYFLYTCWRVLYWSVFCLCWFILPVMKGYFMAGEFTFLTKLRHGAFMHLRSTLIISAIGVIFIIYLFIVQRLSPGNVPTFLVALSNIWGLFLIMMLLGYGLVAIPRTIWHYGNIKRRLNLLYFNVAMMDEELISYRITLRKIIKKAQKLGNQVSQVSPFRKYVDIILAKCDEQTIAPFEEDPFAVLPTPPKKKKK